MRRSNVLPIQRNRAQSTTLPAPVGGWNARDSLAGMGPTDAVTAINIWPTTADVMVRKGYKQFATGLPGQVNSLMVYNGLTASKLFCASTTLFYDASTGGVPTAQVSGLTNDKWQHVNMGTPGGQFLLNVNGADKLRGFDGTSWWVDGDGSHDITGLDTSTCININVFKNRVFLIQENTLNVWYLGVNSIAGAANSFSFQSVARRGGSLVAMGTWTTDAGYGLDDLAVFLTNQGEVLVYRGTDITSATTWTLVGVFQIGAPIGNRCFLKWKGDLLVITQDGVGTLASLIQSSRTDPRVFLTNKIQNAMSTAVATYGANYGWQLQDYPQGQMLILNVPVNQGSIQEQYVMNEITGAWGQFQGQTANCWALYNNQPYFGANKFIGESWQQFSDNNAQINATSVQAFNALGSPGNVKRFTMGKPIFNTNGSPAISFGVNIDFNIQPPNNTLSVATLSGALWDSGIWDASTWGGGLQTSENWQGLTGVGHYAGPTLQIGTQGIEVHWVATPIVYEPGGILG
jgi:hypothetical protein